MPPPPAAPPPAGFIASAPGTVLQYALLLGRLEACLRKVHNADNLFFCERRALGSGLVEQGGRNQLLQGALPGEG
jgi:hypothetical protein